MKLCGRRLQISDGSNCAFLSWKALHGHHSNLKYLSLGLMMFFVMTGSLLGQNPATVVDGTQVNAIVGANADVTPPTKINRGPATITNGNSYHGQITDPTNALFNGTVTITENLAAVRNSTVVKRMTPVINITQHSGSIMIQSDTSPAVPGITLNFSGNISGNQISGHWHVAAGLSVNPQLSGTYTGTRTGKALLLSLNSSDNDLGNLITAEGTLSAAVSPANPQATHVLKNEAGDVLYEIFSDYYWFDDFLELKVEVSGIVSTPLGQGSTALMEVGGFRVSTNGRLPMPTIPIGGVIAKATSPVNSGATHTLGVGFELFSSRVQLDDYLDQNVLLLGRLQKLNGQHPQLLEVLRIIRVFPGPTAPRLVEIQGTLANNPDSAQHSTYILMTEHGMAHYGLYSSHNFPLDQFVGGTVKVVGSMQPPENGLNVIDVLFVIPLGPPPQIGLPTDNTLICGLTVYMAEGTAAQYGPYVLKASATGDVKFILWVKTGSLDDYLTRMVSVSGRVDPGNQPTGVPIINVTTVEPIDW